MSSTPGPKQPGQGSFLVRIISGANILHFMIELTQQKHDILRVGTDPVSTIAKESSKGYSTI